MTAGMRKPNRYHGRVTHDAPRGCDSQGCAGAGEFRAPKSRAPDDGYYWFCLDHVRDYNERWNWFSGFDPDAMAHYADRYATWDRPTWPLGRGPHVKPEGEGFDPHRLFGKVKRRPAVEIEALAVLGLDEDATLPEIKARYKSLLKRYHPDTNGGDRGAERNLARVLDAYQRLSRTPADDRAPYNKRKSNDR